jgi:hypothetical protein
MWSACGQVGGGGTEAWGPEVESGRNCAMRTLCDFRVLQHDKIICCVLQNKEEGYSQALAMSRNWFTQVIVFRE